MNEQVERMNRTNRTILISSFCHWTIRCTLSFGQMDSSKMPRIESWFHLTGVKQIMFSTWPENNIGINWCWWGVCVCARFPCCCSLMLCFVSISGYVENSVSNAFAVVKNYQSNAKWLHIYSVPFATNIIAWCVPINVYTLSLKTNKKHYIFEGPRVYAFLSSFTHFKHCTNAA